MKIVGPHTLVYNTISEKPILFLGEKHHKSLEHINVHEWIQQLCTSSDATLFVERFSEPSKVTQSATNIVARLQVPRKVFVYMKKKDKIFNRTLFSASRIMSHPDIFAYRDSLATWMEKIYVASEDTTDLTTLLFANSVENVQDFVSMIQEKFKMLKPYRRASWDFTIVKNEFKDQVCLGFQTHHPKIATGSNSVDISTSSGARIFAVCALQDLYTMESILLADGPCVCYGGSTHVWQMQWLLESYFEIQNKESFTYHNPKVNDHFLLSDTVFELIANKFQTFTRIPPPTDQ